MRVLVSGASGLLGGALLPALSAAGHEPVPLERAASFSSSAAPSWDPSSGRLGEDTLSGVDAVIHLSGASVDSRWTPERKARIRASRVDSTSLLARTMAGMAAPPRVLVTASGLNFYGSRGNERLTEASPPSKSGFLAGVVQAWEQAADPARAAGIRVVHLRFAVVLTPRGGMLRRLLPPFRLGLGARLGSGRQYLSWVSLDDAARVVLHVLEEDALSGPFITAAPDPVTNAEFTRALARILHRPAVFTIPAAVLRVVFGEMAEETILTSERAFPSRLEDSGFRFRYPELEGALRHLLREEE